MIDIDLFWSYVELWVAVNHYSWDKLAEEVGLSRSTMYRMRRRVGGSEVDLKQFNAICAGIGLMPEFCIMHNQNFGKPMVFNVLK